MSFYMAAFDDENTIVEHDEFADLDSALLAISEKYLEIPPNMHTTIASCRINIWGEITRLAMHSGEGKKFKPEYKNIALIQLAGDKDVALDPKGSTIGEETNYECDIPPYIPPASVDTLQ